MIFYIINPQQERLGFFGWGMGFKFFGMLRFTLLLFSMITASTTISAQSNIVQPQALPNILPPSPDAFSFTKFGDVPIGINTGTAQFNLPIYTINSGSLAHQVSIGYSSNGVKVDEMATRVGINWKLNVGGIITRVIKDEPDEAPGVEPTFFHGPVVWGTYGNSSYDPATNTHTFDPLVWDFYYYCTQVDGGWDFQPDEYFFSVDGMSGRFLRRENGEYTLFSSSPIKIERNPSGFILTSSLGVKYYFYLSEITRHVNISENRILSLVPYDVPTAWHLTRIEDPAGINEIEFNYTGLVSSPQTSITYINGISQVYNTGDLRGWALNTSSFAIGGIVPGVTEAAAPICDGGPIGYGAPLGIFTNVLKTENNPFAISSINFKGGRLEFNYSSREDVVGEKKLDEIRVVTSDNQVIKTVGLEYEYSHYTATNFDTYILPNYNFTLTNSELRKRLFLTQIKEYSNDLTAALQHSFEYEDFNALPPRLSFAQDRYGFFNGVENDYFFSNDTWFDYFLGYIRYGGDRTYHFESAQKGILKKITYPTGGFTRINYEPHKMNGDYAYLHEMDAVVATIDTSSFQGQTFYSDPFYFDGSGILQLKGHCEWATTPPVLITPGGVAIDFEDQFFLSIFLIDLGTNNCLEICSNFIMPGEQLFKWKLGYFNTYGVPPGNYKLKIVANRQSLKGSIVLQTLRKVPDHSPLSGIAGVRVKSLIDYTDQTVEVKRREFLYRDWENENSSSGMGIVLDGGRYEANVDLTVGDAAGTAGSISGCGYNSIHSNSVNEVYLTDQNTVFYRKVIELFTSNSGTNKGGIEYEFFYENRYVSQPISYNWPTHVWGIWPIVPTGSPTMNNDFKTGLLKSTKEFSYDMVGGDREIVKTVENFYSVANMQVDTFIVSAQRIGTVGVPEWPSFAQFLIFKYWRYFGFLRLDKVIETKLEGNNTIVNETTFDEYSFKSYKPKAILSHNSKGQQKKIKRIYPGDVSPSFPAFSVFIAMRNANILEPIIQEEEFVNSVEVSKKLTLYDNFSPGNNFRPSTVFTSLNSSFDVLEVTYDEYDQYGNILQYTGRDGIIHSFIWAYKGLYPIAHIIGATYSDVSALIPNPLVLDSPSDVELDNLFAAIRSGLPNDTRVSTFKYIPLVGLKEVADENGKKTFFEYDGFNRLKVTRDNDNNILQVHEYEYAP